MDSHLQGKAAEKPSYQSERALGYLYRNMVLFEETMDANSQMDAELAGNVALLEVAGWEMFKEEAKELTSNTKA